MRASVVAGMTLAVLALAGPVQAQRPYVQAPFAVAGDTILAVAVRTPLDTAWLGASLLTPIPDVQEPIIQAQDATLPEAFRGDTTLPCLEFECAEPGTRIGFAYCARCLGGRMRRYPPVSIRDRSSFRIR